jgi:transcriptional regulator with XRE-family HTH domain
MSEHEQARAWRERIGLTAEQLADRTGYTRQAIYWFERGETPPMRNAKSGNAADRRHKPWVWLRYKRACGDVDAEMFGRKKGAAFSW